MPIKGTKLPNMRKLTEKQLNLCQKMNTDGMKLKDICKFFKVSGGYLYYHGIRKKKIIYN